MATVDEWVAYAELLPNVALAVFDAADNVPVTERQFADRKVLALALLCRTYNTFRAVLALARQDFVPEMRTLVRSCYENLFLAASLLEKGDAFIEEMLSDEQAAQIGLTKVLFQGHRAEVGDNDVLVKQLKERIGWMRDRTPRPAFIKPRDAAAGTSIARTYLVYRKISGDSAHPSITALKRHLTMSEEDGHKYMGLDVRPPPQAEERLQTIEWACVVLMTVCISVEDILGVDRSKGLVEAANGFEKLKGAPGDWAEPIAEPTAPAS